MSIEVSKMIRRGDFHWILSENSRYSPNLVDLENSARYGWRTRWRRVDERGIDHIISSNGLREVETKTWINFVKSSSHRTIIDCHGDQIDRCLDWMVCGSNCSIKLGQIWTSLSVSLEIVEKPLLFAFCLGFLQNNLIFNFLLHI